MKKNTLPVLLLLYIGCLNVSAQNDTIFLKDVYIHSLKPTNYATGFRVTYSDSLDIQKMNFSSLSEVLQQEGIFFNNYGNGMLSSISLRGTSSQHTSLLWNGFPVEYPSLGQYDFALISPILTENISIHYGGSSAFVGSGAIGGSIQIEEDMPHKYGISFLGKGGSFDTYLLGLKGAFAFKKFSFHTAFFYQSSANKYSYRNNTKPNNPIETQQNGSFTNGGIKMSIQYALSEKKNIQVDTWASHFFRNIINPYTIPLPLDTQEDGSVRTNISYNALTKKKRTYKIQGAYFYDLLLFNTTYNTTHQFLGKLQSEYALYSQLDIQYGIFMRHLLLKIPYYTADKQETRLEGFLGATWIPFPKWKISAYYRMTIINSSFIPFTPSLGQTLKVLAKEKTSIFLKNQINRSYRYPSANERYWVPGGNPDIRPEIGWNIDIGALGIFKTPKTNAEIEITYFHHWIHDWILWSPHQTNNYWIPQNIRKVYSSGIHFSFSLVKKLSFFILKQNIHYFFTQALINDTSEGYFQKYLPYYPIHNGTYSLSFLLKNVEIQNYISYTGKRFTSLDNKNTLSPYIIWNASIGYTWNHFFTIFSVNNILNTDYEILEYRPLPKINFSITLRYEIPLHNFSHTKW